MGNGRAGVRAALVAALAALVTLLAPTCAWAVPKEFNKAAGIWGEGTNWTPAGIPGTGDIATVPAGRTATVSESVSVGALSLEGTVSVASAQTLTVTGGAGSSLASGTLTGAGTTTWNGATTITGPSPSDPALSVSAAVAFNGSTTWSAGQIVVSSGLLTIGGPFSGSAAANGFKTGQVRIADAGVLTLRSFGVNTARIENDGVLVADAPSTTQEVRLTAIDDGPGTTDGTFTAAADTSLFLFGDYGFDATARLTGAGTIALFGDVTIPSAQNALDISGTLIAAASSEGESVDFTGDQVVARLSVGGTRGGTGTIRATGGGTIASATLTGGRTVFDGSTTIGSGSSSSPTTLTLDNAVVAFTGTTSWAGGTILANGTGKVETSGPLTLGPGAGTTIGSANPRLHVLANGTLTRATAGSIDGVENDGLVSTSGGGAYSVGLQNSGSTGSFVSEGPNLAINAPAGVTLAANKRIGGPSIFLNGSVTVPGGTTFDPGELGVAGTLSLATPRTIGALNLFGAATLTGAGSLGVQGATLLQHGTVQIPVTTTGTTLVEPSNGPLTLAADYTANGLFNWTKGSISLTGTTKLRLNGTQSSFILDANQVLGPSTSGVVVGAGSLLVHDSPGAQFVAPLAVAADGTVRNLAGTLQVGTTSIAGTADVVAGTLQGSLTLDGGTLRGGGTVSGTVSGPGAVRPDGTLTIGTYAPGPGTTLHADLGPDASDRLQITTAATLAGTLAIANANGWEPPPGTARTVVGGASISGAFASVTGRALPQGRSWGGSAGLLTVQPRPAPQNETPPSVTGEARQGALLTCADGQWSNGPLDSRGYGWRRDGVAIANAAGKTYRLVAADVALPISCVETATNEGGTSAPAASSNAVTPLPLAPAATAPPGITGSTTRGSELTCTPGSYEHGVTARSYAWTRDGTPIASATSTTYTSTAADVGTAVRCVETASNAGGAGVPATSSPVTIVPPAPVNSAPPALPATATVPVTLTCTPGTWSESPALTYTWRRDGAPIAGATAITYALTDPDAGRTITCVETATNAGGSVEATSNAVTPRARVTQSGGDAAGGPDGGTGTNGTGSGSASAGGAGAGQQGSALAALVARQVIRLAATCRAGRARLTVVLPQGAKLGTATVKLGKAKAKLLTKLVAGKPFTLTVPRRGATTVVVTVSAKDGRRARVTRRYTGCR